MSRNAFMDKTRKPTETELLEKLGSAAIHWQKISGDLEEKYGPLIPDWKFYSKKSGWTLKLVRKKRNLFFMSAEEGAFRITFVFGDRVVAAIEQSDLPADLIGELTAAKKHVEGRGIQIPVENEKDVALVKKLVDFKLGK